MCKKYLIELIMILDNTIISTGVLYVAIDIEALYSNVSRFGGIKVDEAL